MAGEHDSLREGTRLGVGVASGIWLWIAILDIIAGQPLRTFTVLGGITGFTNLHYLLNVGYGILVVSAVHGARREPSLVIAVALGFLVVEIGFAMLTVLLSHLGLGELAWARILGGSLIGAVIALGMLARRHPLVEQLHKAEEQDQE